MTIRNSRARLARELATWPTSDGERQVIHVIARCPDKGPSMPVSLQPDCGCDELYECRRGKGRVSGLVATYDCVCCAVESLRQAQGASVAAVEPSA